MGGRASQAQKEQPRHWQRKRADQLPDPPVAFSPPLTSPLSTSELDFHSTVRLLHQRLSSAGFVFCATASTFPT